MFARTLELVDKAQWHGYAVPAFNIFDDLSLRAVLAGAEQASSPVIVQVSVKTLLALGLERATQMAALAVGEVEVPAALHLDHCPDPVIARQVIDAGWSSVLFDASDRPLEQAVPLTTELAKAAHNAGAVLESEVENIVGVEDGVGSDNLTHAYSIEQLATVAERTNADLIAPALGTSHGQYTARPTLLPGRARKVREAIGRPVVLHGGTGLMDEEFSEFIAAGVSKINVSTAIKLAYMEAAAHHLDIARNSGRWEPLSMFAHINDMVSEEVVRHCAVFGSAGKVVL